MGIAAEIQEDMPICAKEGEQIFILQDNATERHINA